MITSCASKQDADLIINKAIEASGGEKYQNSTINFDFRDHHYMIERRGDEWTMKRIKYDSLATIADTYTSDSFSRTINDSLVQVVDSMIFKYQESINSVFYFALLPYKLNDPAVMAENLDDEVIEGKRYFKIEVRFQEEGGGEDFQDVFIYWFDKSDHSLDYLAYSYETDGGGLRFRKAYNERMVEGIRFVDYINYKAPKDFQLESLAKKFEAGELEELSRIELESLMVSL